MNQSLGTTSKSLSGGTWPVWLGGALLVLAGLAAYANCFHGEFIFDDHGAILGNPHLEHLWPLSQSLWAPPRTTTSGRPTACLSLALNYAVCKLDNTRGYRAVNLAIHLLAALILFGLIRRTFLYSPALNGRFGRASLGLAFSAALLWLLHPLQTELVNYIVQRAESLMALFYLLTLYCALRGWEVERRRGWWHAAAIAACALGMASKEVMVSAPLLVLLYDKIFISGSFKTAWRRSRALYIGLAATWLILAGLVSTGAAAQGSQQGRLLCTPWQYAVTQAMVIFYYLRLAAWPRPLCFDYGLPVQPLSAASLTCLIGIGALLSLTFWALLRKPAAGWVGLFFFALLAPTSSLLPLPDMLCEYRMYLPLAALCVLAVTGGYLLIQNGVVKAGSIVGAVIICVLAVALGSVTFLRNRDYHSAEAIWRDVVIKQPNNPRGHSNYAEALLEKGKLDAAVNEFFRAFCLKPDLEKIHSHLGAALAMQGRKDEAFLHLKEAVRQEPEDPGAQFNLGWFLLENGRRAEAKKCFEAALALNPSYARAREELNRLGQNGTADERR